ncbi:MAG: T9SS type A sorting domain-containing protein, partial [Pedobacter sp.]
IQHSDDATNGNIDASSLDDIDIFKNPANNEFSLKSASPAINKGNNTLYQTPDGVNNTSLTNDKDLEGNPRVYNLITGGTIDLGAYEYQGTLSQTISFAALDAKTTNSADFTLGATASSGLAVSYTSSNTNIAEVYQDNSVWKVKIKAAGSVVITASQSGNGDYAAASAVVQTLVITEGVLPVQLTNYTAKVVNQTAKLDWSVSSERDNRKFVIYRSGDDNQFAEIGGVASLGNTSTNRNYFFVDKQPLNGNNYYKLVQVDLDGKPTELGVKPLNFILSAVHVSVYPNPTKERVNVTFEAGKYNRAALSSIEGKVLKSFELSAQHDQLAIDLSAYSIGTYFIRLTGAQQSIVKKVVKQ